jgi:uroporphyrinogen decarboxylase
VNHRERILAAVQHRRVDRIPTDMWATPEIQQALCRHFGVTHTIDVWDRLDIDGIPEMGPPYIGPVLPPRGEDGYFEDEWGMGYRPQSYASGSYDEQCVYPLAEAESIADLEAYRWPDPDWYDYAALARWAKEHFAGRAFMSGYTAVFYYHNKLRGLELSMMDPLLRPEFTHQLIARLSAFFHEYHRRLFEAGRGLIDLTQVTDDYGSQRGLLISPRVFDQFYRRPVQQAIDLAHEHGLLVFHHDDGEMRPLLPRLVEMGIDVLNPIQWRCGDWDLAELKRTYGGRLCFHSAVDNQQTLPFGTPDDVRREVSYLIDTLACDGTGFIVAPCHDLQPVTPLENILALYDEAHRHGL